VGSASALPFTASRFTGVLQGVSFWEYRQKGFDLCQNVLRLHITRNHEDGVVGGVPGVIKLVEHLPVVLSKDGREPSASWA
jgi:hypothetical protein